MEKDEPRIIIAEFSTAKELYTGTIIEINRLREVLLDSPTDLQIRDKLDYQCKKLDEIYPLYDESRKKIGTLLDTIGPKYRDCL